MKKLVLVVAVISGMVVLNSCEKQDLQVKTQEETFKVDFEKFSVGVENNTLVFETEADLQGCIDYLVEIGEDHFDEFEKSIGYHSFRSTGKELNDYDEIMKTLVNPNLENVICGYLTVSDFEKETAVAYKLNEYEHCDLANLNRSELEATDLTFDDDFFEFAKTGVKLKSESDYCMERLVSAEDDFHIGGTSDDYRFVVTCHSKYSRSFFYKYLQIFYEVRAGKYVPDFFMSYATDGESFYNTNNDEDDDEPFERSEETPAWIDPIGNETVIIAFERRPYTGTSKLERYDMNVDFELLISDYPSAPINKHYDAYNYCIKPFYLLWSLSGSIGQTPFNFKFYEVKNILFNSIFFNFRKGKFC